MHPTAAGFDASLVERVLTDALAPGVKVYGICGLQGSGKSTLASQVAALARSRGVRATVLSVDDAYLGRRERQRLARHVHPLLATRGPPGTHDVELACATLDALRSGTPVALPRFDKPTDTRLAPSRWRRVDAVDLVIFEGWFLATPPQAPEELRETINAVERDEDPDATWRRYCNRALARDYPPLWSRVDRLLFLEPPGFEAVLGWRWQQEQAMRSRRAGRHAMDRPRVERFVRLFERVSRQALRTLPGIADWTLRLDGQRRPLD